MTHFYVCLVGFRYGKSKEDSDPLARRYHRQPHHKQRNSNYLDCIFWEDFNTRDEALAFEATDSNVVLMSSKTRSVPIGANPILKSLTKTLGTAAATC